MRNTHPDPEQPVIQIVREVATEAGETPTDLPPLADSIDARHLSALADPDPGFEALEFTYYGYRVVVREGLDVTVTEDPPDECSRCETEIRRFS